MNSDFAVVVPTLKKEIELPDFLENHEVILSRSPGRSRGRNDGALRATREFILFMDDDAEFTEETYRKYIVSELEEDPSIVISMESPIFSSRVMAISKRLFLELGGFDESFATTEDIDFGYRVLEKGLRISYIPFGLIHHIEHSRPSYSISVIRNFRNKIRLMLKYRQVFIRDSGAMGHKSVKLTPITFIRSLFFTRKLLIFPKIVIVIFGFYYCVFFNKTRLMKYVS